MTAARLVVSPAIFGWIVEGRFRIAAVAMLLATLSDAADGPLVRRFGRPSAAGAWFDIVTDLALVSAAFAGFATAGLMPAWPLAAIAGCFVVFVATSRRRLYDPFGRSIGGLLMAAALGILLVPDLAAQAVLARAAGIACGLTMAWRLVEPWMAHRWRP